MERLLNDREFSEQMAAAQRQAAHLLSPFDGRCLERTLEALAGTGTGRPGP